MEKLSGPDPIRVKYTRAMEMLDVGRSKLDKLCGQGLFTVLEPNGTRGRGKRRFLLYAEVKVYAEQGEDALREYRARATKKARA